MNPIYLDYAAATPLDARVLAAMEPYFGKQFYNPSATYLAAKEVARAVGAARRGVAGGLGARETEVIFTAGGTEANNLALLGVMQTYPGKKVIVSSIEHESIMAMAQTYACAEAPVDTDGVIDVTALERLIDDDTVLVSVMYANNEVGTVQPLRDIARLVQRIRAKRTGARGASSLPLLLHTDATQAAQYLGLHVSRLGVDLMTLNGGKIYGPKQTGVLYVKTGTRLRPLLRGGGQEQGLRSGTENVPGVVGFAEALAIAQAMRPEESRRLKDLQRLFFDMLSMKIPEAAVNGSKTKRLPNNVHITIPGQDNERVLMLLDEAGVMAAAGSACAASNEEPSHVLRAMGISEADAQSSLRFTMGRGTTETDVRRTVDILAGIVA